MRLGQPTASRLCRYRLSWRTLGDPDTPGVDHLAAGRPALDAVALLAPQRSVESAARGRGLIE